MPRGHLPHVGRAIAYGAPPLRLGFAEPPLPHIRGGRGNANRRDRCLERLGFPLPHGHGGEVAAKRTEWGAGNVICDCPALVGRVAAQQRGGGPPMGDCHHTPSTSCSCSV